MYFQRKGFCLKDLITFSFLLFIAAGFFLNRVYSQTEKEGINGTIGKGGIADSKASFTGRHIENRAFGIGEKLYFSVNYGPINAGHTVMSIHEIKEINGARCYSISSVVESNKFFSRFYKVRDVVRTYIDVEGLFPWRYEKHLREGKYVFDYEVDFDQKIRLAYSNFPNSSDRDTAQVPEFIQDALSALYYVRTQPLEVGISLLIPVHDNGKIYDLEVKVYRKEKVKVGAGRFSCFVIEPLLKSIGIFKKKGRLTIWISDDGRGLPVLMKSKVIIGSITAELEEFVPGSGILNSNP